MMTMMMFMCEQNDDRLTVMMTMMMFMCEQNDDRLTDDDDDDVYVRQHDCVVVCYRNTQTQCESASYTTLTCN